MKFKKITMTVHIQPCAQGPITQDERKQLTDFFIALMDLKDAIPDEEQSHDTHK